MTHTPGPGVRPRARRPGRAGRYLRTWLEPSLDEDAQRARKGRLAAALYLAACLYAGFITWQNPQAWVSQTVLVVVVFVLAVTLMVVPWRRFPDHVLIWPVLPSAFFTTVGEGAFGVLGHYQPLYVLALGYAGLVLRPGRTTMLAGLNLALLGGVSALGLQRDHHVEIIGTIVCSALIGELIAAARSVQRRQRSDLQQLHAGIGPLLGAQTEHDTAQLVSELAVRLLRADGALTMVTDQEERPADLGEVSLPPEVLTARGGAGGGEDFTGVQVWLNGEQSGTGIVARTRRHLFVADAATSHLVSRQHIERFGAQSCLYVPILVNERLLGVIVVWWTTRVDDLDHFTDQILELLSLQAGPVLERVRVVEHLDRAATTDGLTGVLNRRAFDQGLAGLPDDAVLLLFDLDRFKALNDSQGHPAGDRVLRAFAAALAASVRDSDLVCRIGGDEFAVIATGDGRAARSVLERLEALWTSPEGVGFSAGYALRRPGEPAEQLSARADEALYEEKNRRRSRAL
ncbi:sensor domain-containing diguanylate cyclase [Kineosporia succinea]|uniref:Diguanylate cyclase (GGDEF)-like protein n=1 Tax=Kineosporia succinea TaxID=84632 RepID=A0ABT9PCY1_9ACTN|nr:diguanylate cyclase [Kineosporia succinea]MDP9830569.1 diguanylate cyclase (GGDEF)-like protein [Kineosporia succinea]